MSEGMTKPSIELFGVRVNVGQRKFSRLKEGNYVKGKSNSLPILKDLSETIMFRSSDSKDNQI